MAKKNLVIVMSIIVIAVGGGVIAYSLKTTQNTTTNSATNPTTTSSDHANMSPSDHTSHSADTMADQPAAGAVIIQNFAFSPAAITVKKGTTVTWTNQDNVAHSVIGSGNGAPKSELLNKGQTYNFTFNTTGTFSYICGPHPYMKGSVTVTD